MIKPFIRDGRAPIPKKIATSLVMRANKARNTKPEVRLRKELSKRGIKGYRLQPKNIPGRPDITFAKSKIGIFVNGCFWHRCPFCKLELPKTNKDFWNSKFEANKRRDRKKIKELKINHWQVLTIWECQINKNPLKQVDKIIKKLNEER